MKKTYISIHKFVDISYFDKTKNILFDSRVEFRKILYKNNNSTATKRTSLLIYSSVNIFRRSTKHDNNTMQKFSKH